jgi:hypothetical protein
MRSVNQVCTFEQAEQLKALGIKQLSLFYWISHPEPAVIFCPKPINNPDTFSAFTSAELMAMLPIFFTVRKIQAGNVLTNEPETYPYICFDEHQQPTYGISCAPSPSQAQADMLIFLINKGYLPVKEANVRLQEADAL